MAIILEVLPGQAGTLALNPLSTEVLFSRARIHVEIIRDTMESKRM